MTTSVSSAATLRAYGFRATAQRIALLDLLETAGRPLTVTAIQQHWPGRAPGHTTLYRALTDLARAGVICRTDLNTGVAHFEYTPDRPHHHHVVCTSCGYIEELSDCLGHKLEDRIQNNTNNFASVDDHTLEFFGTCLTCTKQPTNK